MASVDRSADADRIGTDMGMYANLPNMATGATATATVPVTVPITLTGEIPPVPPGTRQRNPNPNPNPNPSSSSSMMSGRPDGSTPFEGRLSEMMWEVGKKQMNDTLNSYGRIDIFRPYFNVEPKQFRNRLLQSFLPKKPAKIIVTNDMYGPTMVLFTMVAILLLSMKSFGYVVNDGSLIGTALFSCSTAWVLISLTLWACCYLLSADVQPVHVFSAVGYSLFSHCVVIVLVTIFHPQNSHAFFYVMMVLFCVPAALRLSLYLCSKTRDRSHKLAITLVTFVLHLGYLLYLHFGFHVMVEEIDEILGESTELLH